ncbi:hypothetical protein Tco_0611270 [Tanacetum coccineum]
MKICDLDEEERDHLITIRMQKNTIVLLLHLIRRKREEERINHLKQDQVKYRAFTSPKPVGITSHAANICQNKGSVLFRRNHRVIILDEHLNENRYQEEHKSLQTGGNFLGAKGHPPGVYGCDETLDGAATDGLGGETGVTSGECGGVSINGEGLDGTPAVDGFDAVRKECVELYWILTSWK